MSLLLKIHRFILPHDEDIGSSAYVNLFFLSLFFGNLYFRPVHGIEIGLVIAGLIIFLTLYFRAFSAQGNELVFCIAAICLIGIGLSEINIGANIFFVYAAAFCGQFDSREKAFQSLLSVLVLTGLYAIITDKSSYFWIPAMFISGTFGLLSIQTAEVLKKNKALEKSQLETKQLAKIAERERISRDLHDLLGHSLSVITLKSELAGKMLDKGLPLEKIRTEMNTVEVLSRKTLAQVRDAVKGYNTATINGEILQAKVATDAANIELISNIEVKLFSSQVESELALIIREAITNVIRHAETEKVWVILKQTATHLTLKINDQGQMTTNKEQSGMGNMRMRINHIGGTMKVENTPNTQLLFTIPVTDQQRAMTASSKIANE